METFYVSYFCHCMFDQLQTDYAGLLSKWKFCLSWNYSVINKILHVVNNNKKKMPRFCPNISLVETFLWRTAIPTHFYGKKNHLTEKIFNTSKNHHTWQNWKDSRIWMRKHCCFSTQPSLLLKEGHMESPIYFIITGMVQKSSEQYIY